MAQFFCVYSTAHFYGERVFQPSGLHPSCPSALALSGQNPALEVTFTFCPTNIPSIASHEMGL
jgi:hypothetical protein